jgi:D-arabinose 1-dehydrogenase-like Zn-dependent alcohol dehydrogenase
MDPPWAGRRLHFIGIGGAGMSALALVAHALGAEVTGFSGPPPTAPSLFELARVGELCADRRGDVRDAAAVGAAVRRARPEVVFVLVVVGEHGLELDLLLLARIDEQHLGADVGGEELDHVVGE